MATCLMLAGAAAAQPLGDQLRKRVAGFPGQVSLYAKNLDSGEATGIRETEPVRTASTIKLAVMAALFDAVARGELGWSERLTITEAEKVAGSGVIESELSNGVQLPLQDVMHLMMVLSDNTATNMILERFPPTASTPIWTASAWAPRGRCARFWARTGRRASRRRASWRGTRSMAWAFRRHATWSRWWSAWSAANW